MQYKQLTLKQRYQIKAFLAAGFGISSIAKDLKIHKSTVYRELKRNKSKRCYDPEIAHQKALLKRKYSGKKKRVTPEMGRFIRDKLQQGWSPEQIYGYCKKHGIDMISHETIYKYISKDKKAGGTLHKYLRRGGKKRRQYGSLQRASNIKNRTSIEMRPEIVDQKTRIGDLEADLIIGKGQKGALLTVIDRTSRYTFAKLLPNKTAAATAEAMIELLEPIKDIIHTVTVDNGSEFAHHEKISKELNAKVYFAHPYSSWERGANENVNGLIRQFIPKKSSFDGLTDGYVEKVVKNINQRPKKCLEFASPVDVFAERFIV